jgi:putative phosphoribosyl transferase
MAKDRIHRFHDRADAGRRLGRLLQPWAGANPVVLGIPRGGVIVAAEVARMLDAPLGVLVVRKVGAPQNPELAVGAVTAGGLLHLDRPLIDRLGIDEATLTQIVAGQRRLAEERAAAFGGARDTPPATDRTVILVDDGLATGATMALACELVRNESPARLIAAVPVGSPPAIDLIAREADEVVCPLVPPDFHAVGEFYEDFTETTDSDVMRVLEEQQKD